MSSAETLVVFLTATLVFAYMPGPAMLYVAARSVLGGWRSGIMASLGVHLGCYVHILGAAAGLAIILETFPLAQSAIRLAGAFYLIILGWMTLKKGSHVAGEEKLANTSNPSRALLAANRSVFGQSFLIEVLNPKTAIFFLAFLPQFLAQGPDAWPTWLQMLILGGLVNLACTSAELVCVAFAGVVCSGFKKSEFLSNVVKLGGGGTLICLGVALVIWS